MWMVFVILLILPLPLSVHAEYLGELSANPYAPDSTANPFGAGSPSVPCLSGLFGSSGLSDSISSVWG